LDATPLGFWVAVADGSFLELDDVVACERVLPDGRAVRISGVVGQVRARHEGARFDSDVFLVADGVLPAEVGEAAMVQTTRFEPEIFVPPLPGTAVAKATGTDRDHALFFDGMDRMLPAGLSRDDEPFFVNVDFLDGTRGAHVNISGISAVATKTTYATFLFADSEDDRAQYTLVVHNVAARLAHDAVAMGDGAVRIDATVVRTFRELVEVIHAKLDDDLEVERWAGRAVGQGTINAFICRLNGAVRHIEHLVRGDVPEPDRHRIRDDAQVTVVDLHNLNDRAKRFVVGVVLRTQFEAKERSGVAHPLQFVVLDELNKYAPREGWSPIKEILLDVAERGRSLGIILIGAQQTASEVERRIVANSAIRVVGRLDPAEAARGEYGFLPPAQRQRATILEPGTMVVAQPELPVPLMVQFPFPAWATRASEAGANSSASTQPDDPFAGMPT